MSIDWRRTCSCTDSARLTAAHRNAKERPRLDSSVQHAGCCWLSVYLPDGSIANHRYQHNSPEHNHSRIHAFRKHRSRAYRLSLRRVIGIALAASGVIYLINPNKADVSAHTTIGNLLVALSSLLYATYIVISKDVFERYGALNVITWIFLVGAIVTIPFAA